MTPELTFKFYRTYKFYYQGKFDLKKYPGGLPCPPLIQQADRRFFHRISQKLNDSQVHALYTTQFFFHPNAYVADMVTPDAFREAVAFAARAENGKTLLEHELYELGKQLRLVKLDDWLYGEHIDGQRTAIPECLQMVISKELPLDLACILLLVPFAPLGYHWWNFYKEQVTFGMGPMVWIDRLVKADKLIMAQRPGWRVLQWELSETFWPTMETTSLVPVENTKKLTLDV
jgi:hypothetical protein